MSKKTDQNKLTEICVKQNLLLWKVSQSLLDIEKKIIKSTKIYGNT